MSHYSGTLDEPTKMENPQPIDPDISFVGVTSGGRGKIKNHVTPLDDFKIDNDRAREIEKEIIGLMVTKCETIIAAVRGGL